MDWNIRDLIKSRGTQAEKERSPRARQKAFIMAGQSNMIGMGKSKEVKTESLQMPENVRFFQQVWNTEGDVEDHVRRGTFGPELSFAQQIGRAHPDEQIIIIKFASAGTAIASWVENDPHSLPQRGERYRKNIFARLMDFTDPICRDNNAELCAFIWVQGRRDAGNKGRLKHYKENLGQFIADLRDHWQTPELPFIFSQVPDHPGDLPLVLAELMHRFPFNHDLRELQAEFAREQEHVYMVSTDKLRPCPEIIYLNSESTYELGNRLAKQYLELVKTP